MLGNFREQVKVVEIEREITQLFTAHG